MKSLFDFYVISEGLGRYFIIMEVNKDFLSPHISKVEFSRPATKELGIVAAEKLGHWLAKNGLVKIVKMAKWLYGICFGHKNEPNSHISKYVIESQKLASFFNEFARCITR
uniref:Uncharacterized protein n=1 Tax=Rhizophagus irregularis (strain DAOM 181602 / DAOM 197198 / MUCL 43194) TaxID=747089 RepID=U9TV67_RHIID